MPDKFDFDKALAALQSGQDLTGKDGILTPLIKQLTEAALKAEIVWGQCKNPEPRRIYDDNHCHNSCEVKEVSLGNMDFKILRPSHFCPGNSNDFCF